MGVRRTGSARRCHAARIGGTRHTAHARPMVQRAVLGGGVPVALHATMRVARVFRPMSVRALR